MEAKKLEFLLSIQHEINLLQKELGADSPIVQDLEKKFHLLSDSEFISARSNPINSLLLKPIKSDTELIRSHLSIRGNYSIDYSFVTNEIVKKQLLKDNLRMENARFEISGKSELDRFYDFCVNAFYQVEQLVNYYYGTKYPRIDELLSHLEAIHFTKYLENGTKEIIKTKFKRNLNYPEKSINDLTIAVKIFAFNAEFYNKRDDYTGKEIEDLKAVRNEGLHRCEVIIKTNNYENRNLYYFLKNNTFNTVHHLVEKLRNTVKNNI